MIRSRRPAAVAANSKISLYFQEMDSPSPRPVKPVRKSAIVAQHRIKKMFRNEAANNTSNPVKDNKHLYAHMIPKIAGLLDKCEAAVGTENKVPITIELFNLLVKEPLILVYHPRLRNSALKKIEEFERDIMSWKEVMDTLNIESDIRTIVVKTMSIRNKGIQKKMDELAEEMMHRLSEYNNFLELKELRFSMRALRNTILRIKNHPDYVA